MNKDQIFYLFVIFLSLVLSVVIFRMLSKSYDENFGTKNKVNYGYRPTEMSRRLTNVGNIVKLKNIKLAFGLPKNFNWGDLQQHQIYTKLSPGNYLTPIRNQHSPQQYCGSCFVFASLQSLGDRFNIMNAIKNGKRMPDVVLSPQHILNCLPDMTCVKGGDSAMVYAYLQEHGIVHDSCKPYTAQAIQDQCSPECYTCMPVNVSCDKMNLQKLPEDSSIGKDYTMDTVSGPCCKVDNFELYKIEGFSNIRNRYRRTDADESYIDYVKKEIYLNGPVTVAIDADPAETYDKGIISQSNPKAQCNSNPELNHLVSIVGWGEENGISYWIVRNSWGTFYGEDGFFKVQQGVNCIGIEGNNNDIYAAYPKGWSEVTKFPTDQENLKLNLRTIYKP